MTDNMKIIMAKVRAHIMTGRSASTPPSTPSAKQAVPAETSPKKSSLATLSSWEDDDIPF